MKILQISTADRGGGAESVALSLPPLPALDDNSPRPDEPAAKLAERHLQQQAQEQEPQAALQSCERAKRWSRKSTNRRTFAERCLRLGYTA